MLRLRRLPGGTADRLTVGDTVTVDVMVVCSVVVIVLTGKVMEEVSTTVDVIVDVTAAGMDVTVSVCLTVSVRVIGGNV